jgi:hypothetical protein
MPAQRGFSVDSVLRGKPLESSVPRWNITVLRFQLEVMLIYAGLVKLNPDWLQGEPLGLWLSQRSDLPVIGPWLDTPGLAETASLAVIALHLIGAPLLLVRKTRLAVFLLYVLFHLANSMLFHIGIFPWITLAATLLFFDPDWPREIWLRLQDRIETTQETYGGRSTYFYVRPLTLAVIAIFLAFQVVFPMRAVFYPGRASWTGEGDWFAWRMKLDDKVCTSAFFIYNLETGQMKEADADDHLNERQIQLMVSNPDMLLQFVKYLERTVFTNSHPEKIEVRADISCALNGREAQSLVDENVDLTTKTRSWRHYDWILPLAVPLQEANHTRQ